MEAGDGSKVKIQRVIIDSWTHIDYNKKNCWSRAGLLWPAMEIW
jgi:hypothetical protein